MEVGCIKYRWHWPADALEGESGTFLWYVKRHWLAFQHSITSQKNKSSAENSNLIELYLQNVEAKKHSDIHGHGHCVYEADMCIKITLLEDI